MTRPGKVVELTGRGLVWCRVLGIMHDAWLLGGEPGSRSIERALSINPYILVITTLTTTLQFMYWLSKERAGIIIVLCLGIVW